MPDRPILYSFRRCPYAIRARLAIKISSVQVELREVVLADKPEAMLACSPKGTVPVLLLPDGSVIDESLDIMLWALHQHDPQKWLADNPASRDEVNQLVDLNDGEFKQNLDRYKYSDRYPEQPMEVYRQQAEVFLQLLEERLAKNQYLTASNISLADMAILPFIRQFANVDKDWFDRTPYNKLKVWMESLLADKLFSDAMIKYPRWTPGDPDQYF